MLAYLWDRRYVWESPRRRLGLIGSVLVLLSGFVPWSTAHWLFVGEVPIPGYSLLAVAAGIAGLVFVTSRGLDVALMLTGGVMAALGIMFLLQTTTGWASLLGTVTPSIGVFFDIVGGGMAGWSGYAGVRRYAVT
jgi:hypothetical protein